MFRRQKPKSQHEESWPPIYKEIPEFDFPVTEIVDCAHHRSLVHQEIERLSRGDGDPLYKQIKSILQKYDIPTRLNETITCNNAIQPSISGKFEKAERDTIGFFSLLLVALRSKETSIQFVQNEKLIFQARLYQEAGDNLDLAKVHPDLLGRDFTISQTSKSVEIPFEFVFPDMSDMSNINLKNGKVIFEKPNQLRPILVGRFSRMLFEKVQEFEKNNANKGEAFDAIVELFQQSQEVGARTERQNWATLAAEDLETVAYRSFPPCMFNMYRTLKQRHKLFHMGRLQLGLFLKGIGLSLNDSLQVWRSELSKVVGLDGFEKQYAYNIRYNYGKEGAGKSREPYSCMGMIMRCPPPAADQVHGCPFRSMNERELQGLLRDMAKYSPKMKSQQSGGAVLHEIAIKGKNHPQIACAELYKALHGTEYDGTGVVHPCEYFTKSEEEAKEKVEH